MSMYMKLKEQLVFYMKERGITSAELARLSGVPKQRISDLLAGVPPKDLVKLKQICRVLKVTLDELCFGEAASKSPITEYADEIHAGIFEIVLRKVKKNKE